MEKFYRIANIDLVVRIEDDRMYPDDRNLTAFRAAPGADPHRFTVEVREHLDPPAGRELANYPGIRIYETEGGYVRYQGPVQDGFAAAYSRTEHRGKNHHITLSQHYTPAMVTARQVLNAMDVEHLVASEGGVILHASFVEWEGKGILFTAPSETGKSTQAELWKAHRGARIINGDRAVICRDDGEYMASGLPFSGSSRYCESCNVPLAAVVYLRQAPQTTIRKLRGAAAFCRIWEGCSVNPWNREDVNSAMALVQGLVGAVDVYELACTPDESAVQALEAQLRKQVTL